MSIFTADVQMYPCLSFDEYVRKFCEDCHIRKAAYSCQQVYRQLSCCSRVDLV